MACHLNDNSSKRSRRIRGSRSSWGARSVADRMLDEGGFPRQKTAAQPLSLTKHQDPREADERCTGDQSSHNRSRPSGCSWSDACLYPRRLGVNARGDQNAGHRDLAHPDSTWPPQPNSIGVAARSSKEWQSTGAWSAVYRPMSVTTKCFLMGSCEPATGASHWPRPANWPPCRQTQPSTSRRVQTPPAQETPP